MPNERLVFDSVTAGAMPVPERATEWGEPAALSVKVKAAGRLPVTVGLKTTLMVQFAPAASVPVQLLVWEYADAPAPVRAKL